MDTKTDDRPETPNTNETADLVSVLRDKTILTRLNVLEVEVFLARLKEIGLEITPAAAAGPRNEAWVTTAPSSAPPSDKVPSPEIGGGVQAENDALVSPAEVAVHPEMAHNLAPALEGKIERADPDNLDEGTSVVDTGMRIDGAGPVAEGAPQPLAPKDMGVMQNDQRDIPEQPKPEPAKDEQKDESKPAAPANVANPPPSRPASTPTMKNEPPGKLKESPPDRPATPPARDKPANG